MSSSVYEVLSLGMRYVFAFLGVMIVIRSYLWLLRERKERHRRDRTMPDAGMVGGLVVLQGSGRVEKGQTYQVPWEGTLGSGRNCDVILPAPDVRRTHLHMLFTPRHGILVEPVSGQTCVVDGEEVDCRSRGEDHPLRHGSILQIGSVVLRMQFFAGMDIAHKARFLEQDAPPPPPPQIPMQMPPRMPPQPLPPPMPPQETDSIPEGYVLQPLPFKVVPIYPTEDAEEEQNPDLVGIPQETVIPVEGEVTDYQEESRTQPEDGGVYRRRRRHVPEGGKEQ